MRFAIGDVRVVVGKSAGSGRDKATESCRVHLECGLDDVCTLLKAIVHDWLVEVDGV